jgi:UDP-N-acetylglucosamine enolpyruvyl transferase
LLGSEGVDDARAEHIRELETLREMAKVKGHSAVAVRAQELLGRARGVGGDEHTVNMSVHTPLSDVSSSDLRAALASVISQNSSLADLLGDQSAAFKQPDPDDGSDPDEGKALH